MRTEVSISIKNLEVTRGKRQVLKNINLEINKGSITGLLGPSGCGKTTLMRSIVGVQIIKSGEVLVLDKDAGSKDVRKEVGYMSQDPALYSDISVQDNFDYFAKVLQVEKSRIDEVLELTELNDLKKSLVENLSGGERARVSLGVTILSKPQILILDEPTVGVDPLLRRKLWDVFVHLAEDNHTLLISSHVMDEAENCENIILMRSGDIIYKGLKISLAEKTGELGVGNAFIKLLNKADSE